MNPVDSYIEQFPEPVQERLRTIRQIVRELAPAASERICMRIPTFDLNGHWLVHYAGYAKHTGFYPHPSAIVAFADQLRVYKTSKGAVQFPHTQPLPVELIRQMVQFRLAEEAARA